MQSPRFSLPIDLLLPNGLRVFLKPINNAPVVSSWLWYQVGSRNELPGKTGLSHWVEHMQFKGTPKHDGKEVETAIARVGGYTNAFTSPDWTAYFHTIPSHALPMVLEIEADRMVNSLFDPSEVETERTVILSEREGSENNPQFLLGELVQKAAYQHHPYRNEVIGETEDLQRLTREDLYSHYCNYYQPANAALCVAGSFDPEQVLALVQNSFGSISPGSVKRHVPEPEYSLTHGQTVELTGTEEANFIQVAWRSPSAADPDFFAFTLIESILTGPSTLNMFGSGGTGNRTSRLYQNLVENSLAASVYGSLTATIDPATYTLYITCRPDHTPEEVIRAVDTVIDGLLSTKIQTETLEVALKQARANFAYSSDNVTNQAFWMGYANSFSDYSWFVEYVERLRQVTAEDILRVSQQYLSIHNRVIGFYRGQNV
ncbi:MAG: insulinase family protein [Chloroflexi bacterium]|nr:insulinase family protein [Chloroflexota bacterium]